jgi:hypothetical protein
MIHRSQREDAANGVSQVKTLEIRIPCFGSKVP